MGKQRIKPNYRRRVLRLPDLDHCKTAVLNSLGSPASRRVYEYAIDQFIIWYCSEPRLSSDQHHLFEGCFDVSRMIASLEDALNSSMKEGALGDRRYELGVRPSERFFQALGI